MRILVKELQIITDDHGTFEYGYEVVGLIGRTTPRIGTVLSEDIVKEIISGHSCSLDHENYFNGTIEVVGE